jgi:hypothetical protein
VLSTKYGRTQWGNREKWVNLTGRNTPDADAREIPLYAKGHTNTCNNNHTSDAGVLCYVGVSTNLKFKTQARGCIDPVGQIIDLCDHSQGGIEIRICVVGAGVWV